MTWARNDDVVLLSNILHHFAPQQVVELLARVRRAINAGGTVAIWEVCQQDADEAQPDLIGDAFSMFFRMTSTARCSTAGEFTSWLTDAGFTDVQVQALPVGRSLILVTGRAADPIARHCCSFTDTWRRRAPVGVNCSDTRPPFGQGRGVDTRTPGQAFVTKFADFWETPSPATVSTVLPLPARSTRAHRSLERRTANAAATPLGTAEVAHPPNVTIAERRAFK